MQFGNLYIESKVSCYGKRLFLNNSVELETISTKVGFFNLTHPWGQDYPPRI